MDQDQDHGNSEAKGMQFVSGFLYVSCLLQKIRSIHLNQTVIDCHEDYLRIESFV